MITLESNNFIHTPLLLSLDFSRGRDLSRFRLISNNPLSNTYSVSSYHTRF